MDFTAAFHRANALREAGDLAGLRQLFQSGDAGVKAGVLNGLTGEPGLNPEMGPGIVALAIEGAGHTSPEVRHWACVVFQNQSAWRVDVATAIAPLLNLLSDSDWEVRRMAAFAVGNVYKRRYDFAPHFSALHRLLSDQNHFVSEAAAWAISKMAAARYDIGPAVPDLFVLLGSGQDSDRPRKEAARALLHHARKTSQALEQVKQGVARGGLDARRKEVKRFLDQLDAL